MGRASRQGQRLVHAVKITGSNTDLASWGTPLPANTSSYPPLGKDGGSFTWERVPLQ